MSRDYRKYGEEEKLALLHAYYESGMSQRSFCKLHKISCNTVLLRWISKYSKAEKELNLPAEEKPEEMANRSKAEYQEEIAQLKKRVKALEKALDFSKLETEARDLLIERAEEYFKIPIRKKPGAK